MTIDCRDFETRLEELIRGELGDQARRDCERHLRGCERCAGLVELATVPIPIPTDDDRSLTEAVLLRTSGSACARAEPLLAGALPEGATNELKLLERHLEHCESCRALSGALAELDHVLPTLAELTPGAGFVDRVLAASLPLPARLRRWRRRTWPAWVRRPRFALEMAYALTAFVAILISIPGSPLAAMPEQAVSLARTSPIEALEEPVRESLAAWEGSTAHRQLTTLPARWSATERLVRTFLSDAASWWENATEGSSSQPTETTEESS